MEVLKPPVLIVTCPPVQRALDPEYPRLRPLGLRPRRDAIQRRPPRLPDHRCRSAASLRHAAGFPGLGLLRRLRPTPRPTADSEPCPHHAGGPRMVPTFIADRSTGTAPSFSPAASP